MLDQEKNSFMARVPFKQHLTYLLWLKVSVVLLLSLILGLVYWSASSYKKYRKMLNQKTSLLTISGRLDELVRKKNKLLAQDHNQVKHGKRNLGVHARIIDYLNQIESALVLGVELNSFEYTAKKIEVTGYCKDIQSLSQTITNLQKLSFVKDYELEQISNNNSSVGNKLAFTITLSL